jgi:hypothetical protein
MITSYKSQNCKVKIFLCIFLLVNGIRVPIITGDPGYGIMSVTHLEEFTVVKSYVYITDPELSCPDPKLDHLQQEKIDSDSQF